MTMHNTHTLTTTWSAILTPGDIIHTFTFLSPDRTQASLRSNQVSWLSWIMAYLGRDSLDILRMLAVFLSSTESRVLAGRE